METYWVPGVNGLGEHGRWAFAEFTEVFELEPGLNAKIAVEFGKLMERV